MAPAGMMVVVRKLGGHGGCSGSSITGRGRYCYNITLPDVHGSIASEGEWGRGAGSRPADVIPHRRERPIRGGSGRG
jgi:hypothetical protein